MAYLSIQRLNSNQITEKATSINLGVAFLIKEHFETKDIENCFTNSLMSQR